MSSVDSVKLSLGKTVVTSNANNLLDHVDVAAALARHCCLDWGEVCSEDWRSNDEAMRHGYRVLSVYRDRNDVKFWIITEADRSYTTVLMPEDY